MPLHATLGEETHAWNYYLLSPRGNWSMQLHMQEATQLLGENAHFWMGIELAAQKIYAISG